METRLLKKSQLLSFITGLMEQQAVFAPVKKGDFTHFQQLKQADELDLESAHNTRYPPKALFQPQSEPLFEFRDGKFVSLLGEIQPRVIFGIRPCDVHALQLLDTVFNAEGAQDPYWLAKREKTTIITIGCKQPCSTCFCTSVGGSPFDCRGSDLLLTDMGDYYAVEVVTDRGNALVQSMPVAAGSQANDVKDVQTKAEASLPKAFDPTGIRDKLYQLFSSDYWEKMQQSCLGCGVCTYLCPTCFCFDIVDEKQRSQRVRNWDTCMFRVYTQEASGHNPRPTKLERTRQRIMHKYAYWLDNINEIGCTGCGRCVRYCPVNLDIRWMIQTAQNWVEA
jgi:ferredoxin